MVRRIYTLKYLCPYCPEEFKYRTNLYNHLREIHSSFVEEAKAIAYANQKKLGKHIRRIIVK
jgi:biotin synthase-like enzyme